METISKCISETQKADPDPRMPNAYTFITYPTLSTLETPKA